MLRLTEIEHEYQKTKEDIKQMMGDSYIKELTQDVVDTFIKKVYVYKGKKIEIEWNFNRGCMK